MRLGFRAGWIALVCTLVFLAGSASATPLLSDNFNDNSLNTSVWRTDTSTPAGGASVEEMNQRIELMNRGHLITQQQFDPATIPGGLRISLEWTPVFLDSPYESLNIVTRSDAVPAQYHYGEAEYGISFQATWTKLGVYSHNPLLGPSVGLIDHGLDIDSGDTFSFVVEDDGTNLSFTLTEISGSQVGATASVTATDSTVFASNFITIYNREYTNSGGDYGNKLSYIDNLTITNPIPEPSTALLLGLGLVGMAAVRRRVR